MTLPEKPQALGKHQGPDHSAPYPVSRMAPAIELVDLAKEIAQADNMLTQIAHGKLGVIAEQIRTLQSQAQQILQETELSHRLHKAQCGFKKIPGRHYHLYRREDGSEYFSMLSPQEWGNSSPHSFQGSYRLENDMSWTVLKDDIPSGQAPSAESNISAEPEIIVERFLEQKF